MAADKRARKRAIREERQAALRRRRNARLGGIAALIAIVVAVAVFAGRDSGQPASGDEPAPEAAAAACEAEAPPEASPKEYAEPEQVLEEGVDYGAVIHTSCGDIHIDLFEAEAPKTVNSFVFLAREGYFDGLIWHRISANFVIQTGDPNGQNGTPPDGPGYQLPDENLPEKGNVYRFGVVAMANSGPDTAGSQFFIISHLGPNDEIDPAALDPFYSIFGQASEGSFGAILQIAQQETKGGNDPVEAELPIVPVYIESIEIIEA